MTANVHALVLAAGRSSRTGASHKLFATFDGVPLIRRSVSTALAAKVDGATVILGYRADEMRRALNGLPVRILDNPRWPEGLSTSLVAGFDAGPKSAAGILVLLADQPLLTADHLNRLVAAFSPTGSGSIVVATDNGRRFNPVLISSSYQSDIKQLSGEVGARSLLVRHTDLVREVEIGRAASFDVDTPEAVAEAGGRPEATDRSK